MRDMMFAVLFIPLLFMSIRNGFVAYLLWAWAGLMAIETYLYGFMVGFSYVQLFAVIALAHFFLKKDSDRQPFSPDRTTVLLIVFATHISICALFALGGHTRTWEMAGNMFKTVLFCVLMPMIVTTRLRLHALLIVVALGTAFHGMVDGLKFVASAGRHLAHGIAKFGDNNHFAIVMTMVIPLLGHLSKFSANRNVKLGLFGMIPLTVLAVIATQSRGGFIALAVVGLWYVLTSKRKHIGIIAVLVCGGLVMGFASDDWVARIQTINTAKEDSSLQQRIGAWQVNTAIALQNPIFGGGPLVSEVGTMWSLFRDAPGLLGFLPMDLNGLPGRGRAVHSIFFQAMGDLGFVGFILFLVILGNAFITAGSICKQCKASGPQFDWALSLAQMLKLSLLAYAVAGALLSALYFELPYMLMMMLQVLKIQVEKGTTTITRNQPGIVDTDQSHKMRIKMGVSH